MGYLVYQHLNQPRSRERNCGPDESTTSKCCVQNAYPPNRTETTGHLPQIRGQTTAIREQITKTDRHTAVVIGRDSHHAQGAPYAGPRRNPAGGIQQPGGMVIHAARHPTFYDKQAMYFKDSI
ncbi:type IV secretory system conjugative DNA transfer family protein [Herbaspirillum seropedicae]|uniref:type IV secretory system conjugative DNA transfer family protein n=1 Tax=Herbaspirillum seropedicae TaxID=964 RepID=UPI0015DE7FCD